ncbi:MAG: 50S ribosomal protein L10 [Candidatus Portnoybacteria bacterium]|nr:50S ribosomal protein L10 [Candidatus Portnoybacteria bacterium]
MPLTQEQKIQTVAEIKDKLLRKKAAFFVSFTGVDVKTSQDLRKSLKGKEAEYTVVKKTLLARALNEEGIKVPFPALSGQVGIAFDYGSQVNAARTLYEFTKKSSFSLLGGILDRSFLDSEAAKTLAQLPSLEVMHQKLCYVLQSPMANFLGTLRALPLRLMYALAQVKAQKI